jgi:hypothetical protein
MTTKNTAAKDLQAEELDAEAKVPSQATKVTSIKKNEEPEFFGENTEESEPLKYRVRRILKNKRIIAGAITTAVLGTAVLVIRKRNSVEETDETPQA